MTHSSLHHKFVKLITLLHIVHHCGFLIPHRKTCHVKYIVRFIVFGDCSFQVQVLYGRL